jgi:hypothetical protein
LKAILKIADSYEWGAEIATDKQLKKYKNSDEIIDKATLDRLIGALKRTGLLKSTPTVFRMTPVSEESRARDSARDSEL